MSSIKLEWTRAEVKDARLTVPLDGQPPDGWKQSFETTVALLGDGEWGEIQVKKGKVQVSDVEPGAEDKLRHHLEAIVDQANAHLQAREQEAEEDRDPDDGDEEEDRGPDARMTERFQAFAGDSEDSEAAG